MFISIVFTLWNSILYSTLYSGFRTCEGSEIMFRACLTTAGRVIGGDYAYRHWSVPQECLIY